MAQRKLDRRVQRTRQLLHQALIELITEKSYDKITVQDILDRANIGRSTFYAHFTDKNDLLRSQLDSFRFDLQHHQAEDQKPSVIISVKHIFEHGVENYHLHRALIGSQGVEIVRQAAHNQLVEGIVQHLEEAQAAGHPIPVPPIIVAQFLAGALHALIGWWLDEQMPYSPSEMEDMFQLLTSSMVRQFAEHLHGEKSS